MLTIAVCDDNRTFADMLLQKIRHLCAYNLPDRIACQTAPAFYSAEEVTSYLTSRSINILFLDIDMPEKNGFELAGLLQKTHPDMLIIFVSAYDQFVYSCFEYSPFRFLRKTHLDEELRPTLEKAVEKCVLQNETMTFRTTGGEVTLLLRDILYFEGEKNYYIVHYSSGENYRCRGTVTQVEEMTAKYDFIRIHSALVINLSHVEAITDLDCVRMSDGSDLQISRRNMTAFKHAFMQYTRRRSGI